ncbi:deaminase [Streptomyces sp. WZ.A104]|uniref:dihydrofolate reductase family protein n=1 Tax=Streptomyces sp. WZ.A104 TaxID=2023771 RepID=UPI000BBCD2DB|nr:dihydrofolate reductase family protein [Streptomyces sp. WZ.A104]PCG86608.1 deaminase [Streptomyces sp. WZ.A104]
MAELTLTAFLTLDGVYQAPGGVDEDTSGGFAYGGWVFPYADEDMGAFMEEVFRRPAAFLLGRRTYDIFAAYWPKVTEEDDLIAAGLNELPKYVVSSTLRDPQWQGTTVLDGDLVTEVTRLKERTRGGELQVHGSGQLARALHEAGLIDTYRLLVFPVLLGAGRRLFGEGGAPTALEPTSARTTSSGIAIQTYRRGGPARFGTIGE